MIIAIVTASILVITAAVWRLNRISFLKICPICTGVSGTWFWILAGIYFGLLDAGSWSLAAAMLMGGSVVGIAYQLEKKLPVGKSQFLWKMVFIPAGFISVYGILTEQWIAFFAAMIFLALISFLFIREQKHRGPGNRVVGELTEKMKNCC